MLTEESALHKIFDCIRGTDKYVNKFNCLCLMQIPLPVPSPSPSTPQEVSSDIIIGTDTRASETSDESSNAAADDAYDERYFDLSQSLPGLKRLTLDIASVLDEYKRSTINSTNVDLSEGDSGEENTFEDEFEVDSLFENTTSLYLNY